MNKLKMRSKAFAFGLFAVAASSAQAITVATFADPTIGQSNPTPLFTFSPDGPNGTLDGGYEGLTLATFVGTFTGVSFELEGDGNGFVEATASVADRYNLGAGSVRFFTGSDANLLTIAFDSGTLTNTGFGSSDQQGGNVTFSGTIAGANLFNEAFAFTFANPKASGSDITYTASFTSSADAVPEPASLAALGLGALTLLRRRRR